MRAFPTESKHHDDCYSNSNDRDTDRGSIRNSGTSSSNPQTGGGNRSVIRNGRAVTPPQVATSDSLLSMVSFHIIDASPSTHARELDVFNIPITDQQDEPPIEPFNSFGQLAAALERALDIISSSDFESQEDDDEIYYGHISLPIIERQ